MSVSKTENHNGTNTNRKEDIDSKIADFMADIDEIVLGKKSVTNTATTNNNHETSEWKECFDETSQSIYYWNTVTNESSWDPPSTVSQNHLSEKSPNSTNVDGINNKKRQQPPADDESTKTVKKPSLIAEYASSESETSEDDEGNVDDIDELLNEVLDKEDKSNKKNQSADLYPLFEADCRAAISRLMDLGDKNPEVFTLRIQLETRLEDCLSGHLSKSYAVSKLEQALIKVEEIEKSLLASTSFPAIPETLQAPLTSSEMVLLLSLPPPPPPPSSPPPPILSSSSSSPPPPSNYDDETLQLFYAQINDDPPEPMSSSTSDIETITNTMKSESQHQHHHHHHHHHKDKKMKPAKTLPTDLIQKWTHAQQELRGIADIDES